MNRQIRKKAFKQREKYGEFLRKLYQILDDVFNHNILGRSRLWY
jgi:hypothetical protein